MHPEQPGSSISREKFEELWRHSVLLLQRGFQTGSILTVTDADAKALGRPWTRRCAMWCQISCHHIFPVEFLSYFKMVDPLQFFLRSSFPAVIVQELNES